MNSGLSKTTSWRYRSGTRRTKRHGLVKGWRPCYVVPCPPFRDVTLTAVRVPLIDLTGWSGEPDNAYTKAYAEMFDAVLDSGELLLYDPATGETHPVTRRSDDR